MTRTIAFRRVWSGLLLGAAQLSLLAAAAGCDNKSKAGADDAAGEVAAAAPEVVEPPAPVVAEDPEIPLNEAVVGSAPVPADYAAPSPPPAEAVVEEQPPRPAPADVWIPGYWWWSCHLARYVWIGGAWRNAPPD